MITAAVFKFSSAGVGFIGTLLLGMDGFRRTILVSISAFSLLQAQECFSNGF